MSEADAVLSRLQWSVRALAQPDDVQRSFFPENETGTQLNGIKLAATPRRHCTY
jgi:hypothetical protein